LGLEFFDATGLVFALIAQIVGLAISDRQQLFDIVHFLFHDVQPTSRFLAVLHETFQFSRADFLGRFHLGGQFGGTTTNMLTRDFEIAVVQFGNIVVIITNLVGRVLHLATFVARIEG